MNDKVEVDKDLFYDMNLTLAFMWLMLHDDKTTQGSVPYYWQDHVEKAKEDLDVLMNKIREVIKGFPSEK